MYRLVLLCFLLFSFKIHTNEQEKILFIGTGYVGLVTGTCFA